MDELQNYKRRPKTHDAELWLVAFTGIFGISLLVYGLVVLIGGLIFFESLGGINTLVALIFGTFVSLMVTIHYKHNSY
jgi:hypothetical protein